MNQTCTECGAKMKMLLVSLYCPRGCKEKKPEVKLPPPYELEYVCSTVGKSTKISYGVYVIREPNKEWVADRVCQYWQSEQPLTRHGRVNTADVKADIGKAIKHANSTTCDIGSNRTKVGTRFPNPSYYIFLEE